MRHHKTWWGEAFIAALEAFIDPGRLQRGRAYRSDHRILSFDCQGSVIKATVRGNINPYFGVTKEPRYRVQIAFEAIEKSQWTTIIANICENAGWLSKLMLNEIPHDLNMAFGQAALLPKSYRQIEASCSCPDDANPCKHIAGVYFRVANILDANPMLLFTLKGIEPHELHEQLKKSELGQAFAEHLSIPEAIELEYQSHRFSVLKTQKQHSANASQQKFWGMGHWDLEAPAPTHECSAALIKKQGDYPPFWNKTTSFIKAMEDFYETTRKKNKAFL